MKPTIKPKMRMTIHRDRTVSYWDVYRQQWLRCSVFSLVEKHDVFASFSNTERRLINNAVNRALDG